MAAAVGLLCSARAQSIYDRPSWYVSFFGGHSARVLGSQDIRTDYGFGFAWARPEPRFKWRHGPTQLVMEGYYEHSNGQSNPAPGRITDAVGLLWYARFRFPTRGFNLFGDIGWGGQVANSKSFDLSTKLNSSPVFAFGVAIRQGHQETLLGVRLMHLSNAGLSRPNRGQNQLLLFAGVKF